MTALPSRRTRWLRATALLSLASAMQRVGAQSLSGVAAVDSASVARAAWTRAVAAFGAHDVATARREVERAASAWPLQPAYLWGWAVAEQAMADTAALLIALDAYAALGLGRDLHADARFAGYTALSRRYPIPRSGRREWTTIRAPVSIT